MERAEAERRAACYDDAVIDRAEERHGPLDLLMDEAWWPPEPVLGGEG